MKFEDLIFEDHVHKDFGFDKAAKHTFPNNYGISVITGEKAFCTDDTYEVAILYNDCLTYDTEITNDVLSNQSEEDINRVLQILESY